MADQLGAWQQAVLDYAEQQGLNVSGG
jgi:hypothetical protein